METSQVEDAIYEAKMNKSAIAALAKERLITYFGRTKYGCAGRCGCGCGHGCECGCVGVCACVCGGRPPIQASRSEGREAAVQVGGARDVKCRLGFCDRSPIANLPLSNLPLPLTLVASCPQTVCRSGGDVCVCAWGGGGWVSTASALVLMLSRKNLQEKGEGLGSPGDCAIRSPSGCADDDSFYSSFIFCPPFPRISQSHDHTRMRACDRVRSKPPVCSGHVLPYWSLAICNQTIRHICVRGGEVHYMRSGTVRDGGRALLPSATGAARLIHCRVASAQTNPRRRQGHPRQ
jgi:hypothetical protein